MIRIEELRELVLRCMIVEELRELVLHCKIVVGRYKIVGERYKKPVERRLVQRCKRVEELNSLVPVQHCKRVEGQEPSRIEVMKRNRHLKQV